MRGLNHAIRRINQLNLSVHQRDIARIHLTVAIEIVERGTRH